MKSEQEVRYDIQVLGQMIAEKPTASRKNRLNELNQVLRYILTNPTEEFVRKQLEQVSLKIKKTLELGPNESHYRFTEPYKRAMKQYEKDSGIVQMMKQQSILVYILNDSL
jgi:hypothetical protein